MQSIVTTNQKERKIEKMDLELLAALLDGLIFYGFICLLPFLALDLLKQHNIRKLCKYRGVKGKPGPACVICAYHHECARAKQSTEYKQYSYYRRVLPDTAKELFDKIWEEEKARPKK